MANTAKSSKQVKSSSPKTPKNKTTYVNVNRSSSEYKGKYSRDVEKAVLDFAKKLGKSDASKLTKSEWKKFFKTVLIPLDKESEKKMIDLFVSNRDELNELLILHNTLASNNLAEVYFKKYEKECPTHWHDLDDFKQMALEGLAIAANRFDVNSGNKFITYATWWVLNRVRKPYQERGAMSGHTSFSSPTHPFDSDSTSTLEDVFTSDMISPDCGCCDEDSTNPVTIIDSNSINENYDFCTEMKKLKTMDGLDSEKAKDMVNYLVGLVERSEDSNRQIFLYMFRKIFNKCNSLFKGGEGRKLKKFVSEAAKSKSELLKRLNMDEKEYASVCKTLMRRGNYDGI